VNAHAAPSPLLSPGPPISAVALLSDPARATLEPNWPGDAGLLTSAPPVSLDPCWVQVEPVRVNTHAAPRPLLSPGPPTSAVLPAAESATLEPNCPSPCSPPAVILDPCWVPVEPERVKTHPAPGFP